MIQVRNFDDLSMLYRAELKSSKLADVEKDVYERISDVIATLKRNADLYYQEDPESPAGDKERSRMRKARRMASDIASMRIQKLAVIAVRETSGKSPEGRSIPECEAALIESMKGSIFEMRRNLEEGGVL